MLLLTVLSFSLGKFRKEFRRAFEHCCRTTTSAQLNYHLDTLYSKSAESGLGSKTYSTYAKRNTNTLRNRSNDDLAEQSLIRQGTKTSVVRLDIWLENSDQCTRVAQNNWKSTVMRKLEYYNGEQVTTYPLCWNVMNYLRLAIVKQAGKLASCLRVQFWMYIKIIF